MLLRYTLFTCTILFLACQQGSNCHDPVGQFSNKEGLDIVFEGANKMLWLTRFGSQTDTQICTFHIDCNTDPAALDMQGFNSGPYIGKTLLGILQWSNDSSFRIQFDQYIRPKDFEQQQVMQFYKSE